MIGYVTIGTNDGEKSGKFYDAVFGAFGIERKFADGGWIGYGPKGEDKHNVYVCPPFDGQPATFGNGSMLAFKANTKADVDAAYKAGLAHAARMKARRASGRRRKRPSMAPICATQPATRSRFITRRKAAFFRIRTRCAGRRGGCYAFSWMCSGKRQCVPSK